MADHLVHWQPTENNVVSNYHGVLKEALRVDTRESEVASALCAPSIDPEWSLRLRQTGEGAVAEVTVSACNLWFANDRKPSRNDVNGAISEYRRDLAPEFFHELQELWIAEVHQANPDACPVAGLDGSLYWFHAHSARNSEAMGGWTWSPESRSRMGYFVGILHALYDYVLAESDRRVLQRPMRAVKTFHSLRTIKASMKRLHAS